MTVSSSPKLSQVVAEFGGPGNLKAYYRGGPYVPNTTANANISTSASSLKLSQFAGASNVTSHTTYKVTSSVTQRWTFGCVVEGTPIWLPDGSTKLIEKVNPEDALLSVKLPGLQPETIEDYADYSETSLDGAAIATTYAKANNKGLRDAIYEITWEGHDTPLRVTPDHPFFILDDTGLYRFAQAQELSVNDCVIDHTLTTRKVASLVKVPGDFVIYKLDCAPYDLFIHEGIVGHNAKPGQYDPMDHQTIVTTSFTTFWVTSGSGSLPIDPNV